MPNKRSEIEAMERFLNQQLNATERIQMVEFLQNNKAAQRRLEALKKSYDLIRISGRKQLYQELETLHQKLWHQNAYVHFRRQIKSIFNL